MSDLVRSPSTSKNGDVLVPVIYSTTGSKITIAISRDATSASLLTYLCKKLGVPAKEHAQARLVLTTDKGRSVQTMAVGPPLLAQTSKDRLLAARAEFVSGETGTFFEKLAALQGIVVPQSLASAVAELGLRAVLESSEWAPKFVAACEMNNNGENPRLYLAILDYRRLSDAEARQARARQLYEQYINPAAARELVNLKGTTVAAIEEHMAAGEIGLYDDVLRELLKLMQNNIVWEALHDAESAKSSGSSSSRGRSQPGTIHRNLFSSPTRTMSTLINDADSDDDDDDDK